MLARLAPPPHEAGHDRDQAEEEGDGDAAHGPLGALPLRPRQHRTQLCTELGVEEAAVLLRHVQACYLEFRLCEECILLLFCFRLNFQLH